MHSWLIGSRWFFAFFFSILSISSYGNTSNPPLPAKFILGSGTEAHIFTGLWERLVYTEAFRRLDVPLVILVAPLKRIELMLEVGEIDGETMRGPAYALLHPKLIAVDLPLMPVRYGIYALKQVPGLSRPEDLRSGKFRGIYRRGVLFCQNTLSPLIPERKLVAVTTVKQGIDMLAIDHTDFFCDVNLGVINHEYSSTSNSSKKLQKLFDISDPVSNSAYLHEKYAAFAVTLAETLKQMEKEGLFEKYRLETLARLLQQQLKLNGSRAQ